MTLLTGSDMSVINSDPKRKDYSDHSSYSYSGIRQEKNRGEGVRMDEHGLFFNFEDGNLPWLEEHIHVRANSLLVSSA